MSESPETLSSSTVYRWFLPALLLTGHFLLMIHAATQLSPTWDEIVYPAAGVNQWQTRAITLSSDHTFLAKLVIALPVLLLKLDLPLSDGSEKDLNDFRIGYRFTFHNRAPARQIIFWSRMPAVVFSVLTALLLFLWIQSLWGTIGALIVLTAYTTTPIFLSRGCLALLEMPMYFFIVACLWAHSRSRNPENQTMLMLSGIFLGLALLCKMSAVPLVAALIMLGLWPLSQARGKFDQLWRTGLVLVVAAFVVGLAYLPWHGAQAAFTRAVFWNTTHFDERVPDYFFHGRFWPDAPAVLSWIAWGIKAPLGILLLSAWGAWRWWASGRNRWALLHFLVPSACFFFWILAVHKAVSTIHLSPLYLGVVGATGGLAVVFVENKRWAKIGVLTLLVAGAYDVWRIHPNYIAYFNVLSGGPEQGYRWLADSDQDWGQSLPALGAYVRQQGNADLLLCYSGAADPSAYGIVYQDLLSPALVTRDHPGTLLPVVSNRRTLVAVASKVLQTEPGAFNELQTHVPLEALIGQTFFIYDITNNPDAYRWVASLYNDTQRPALARWALARAQAASHP